MTHVTIVPVLLPFTCAVVMILMGERRLGVQRAVGLLSCGTLLVIASAAVVGASSGAIEVYRLGDWPAPFGIVLVRDRLAALMLALAAVVAGVSRDSLKSHQNFRARQGFGFELASDPDEQLCKAFDVIKPKKLYGREYVGIERSTFLLDPEGVIREAWRPVKVPGHAQAVLDALKAAQTQ